MAVIRKRRTLHTKSSRQQQLQQQQQLRAKQRFESSRLKPEQSTTMIHDESDTISFKSHLLMNFVKSAEYMDVLMTQAIPNDKIRLAPVFPSSKSLEAMKQRISVQKEQLRDAKEALDSFCWGDDGKLRFLKDKLAKTETEPEDTVPVLQEYLREFGLRSQSSRAVFHRNKFDHLRGDMREAPADYWHQHSLRMEEQRKKALMLKEREEEERREKLRLIEVEKRKREMEEDRRREEVERQKQLEQLQKNAMSQAGSPHGQMAFAGSNQGSFPQAQTISGAQFAMQGQAAASATPLQLPEQLPNGGQQYFNQQVSQTSESGEQHQQPPLASGQDTTQKQSQQQQRPLQPAASGVESIFGGFDDEPFNNGFEDEFGDLDTAFF